MQPAHQDLGFMRLDRTLFYVYLHWSKSSWTSLPVSGFHMHTKINRCTVPLDPTVIGTQFFILISTEATQSFCSDPMLFVTIFAWLLICQSITESKTLTDEVNNIDYLITMAAATGCGILGSKWTVEYLKLMSWKQEKWASSEIGSERRWQEPNCDG